MSGTELFADAMAEIRYEAALELVHAVDTIVLLEQIDKVRPGWFPITETDRRHVQDARANWLAVRA